MSRKQTPLDEALKDAREANREVERLTARVSQLKQERDALEVKLNSVNHEWRNREQACRALEFALSVVVGQLKAHQLETKKFKFDEGEWVALAE